MASSTYFYPFLWVVISVIGGILIQKIIIRILKYFIVNKFLDQSCDCGFSLTTFSIWATNIKIPESLLDIINATLPDSCKFEAIQAKELQLRLYPPKIVLTRPFVQLYGDSPEYWDLSRAVKYYRKLRFSIVDLVTNALNSTTNPQNSFLFKILSYVDYFVLKKASVSLIDITVVYCPLYEENSGSNIQITALCHSILARPSPSIYPSSLASSSPHQTTFTINVHDLRVKTDVYHHGPPFLSYVDLVSEKEEEEEEEEEWMLHPISLTSKLSIPSLTTMLDPTPLSTKNGYILISAAKLRVDLRPQDVVAVANLACAIKCYKNWWEDVMGILEHHLLSLFLNSPSATDFLCSYSTLYSQFVLMRTLVGGESLKGVKKELTNLFPDIFTTSRDDLEEMEEQLPMAWILKARSFIHKWDAIKANTDLKSPGPDDTEGKGEEDENFINFEGLSDVILGDAEAMRRFYVDMEVDKVDIRFFLMEDFIPLIITDLDMHIEEPIPDPAHPHDEDRIIDISLQRLQLGVSSLPPRSSSSQSGDRRSETQSMNSVSWIIDRPFLYEDLSRTNQRSGPTKFQRQQSQYGGRGGSKAFSNKEKRMVILHLVQDPVTDAIDLELQSNGLAIMPEVDSLAHMAVILLPFLFHVFDRVTFFLEATQIDYRRISSVSEALQSEHEYHIYHPVIQSSSALIPHHPKRSNRGHHHLHLNPLRFQSSHHQQYQQRRRKSIWEKWSLLKGEDMNIKIQAFDVCLVIAEKTHSNTRSVVFKMDGEVELFSSIGRELMVVKAHDIILLPCIAVYEEIPPEFNDISTAFPPSVSPTLGYQQSLVQRFKMMVLIVQEGLAFLEPFSASMTYESNLTFVARRTHDQSSSNYQSEDHEDGDLYVRPQLTVNLDPITLNVAEVETLIIWSWILRGWRDSVLLFNSGLISQISSEYLHDLLEKHTSLMQAVQLHQILSSFSTESYLSSNDSSLTAEKVIERILDPLPLTMTEKLEEKRELLELLHLRNVNENLKEEDIQKIESLLLSFHQNEGSQKLHGTLDLVASEYQGGHPLIPIDDALEGDDDAVDLMWERIQQETGAKRGEFDSIQPRAFQKMLVRMCRDLSLAEVVWTKLICPSFSEDVFQHYPWLIFQEDVIGGHIHANKLANIIAKQLKNKRGDVMSGMQDGFGNDSNNVEIASSSGSFDERSPQGETTGGGQQNSHDSFILDFRCDFQIGTCKFQVIDSLLGPSTPRFNIIIPNPHLHIHTNLHSPSSLRFLHHRHDILHAHFFFSFSVDFFNSFVSSYEPLIEKWVLNGFANKDFNGIPTCEVEGTMLSLNISSAFLRTASVSVGALLQRRSGCKRFQDSSDTSNQMNLSELPPINPSSTPQLTPSSSTSSPRNSIPILSPRNSSSNSRYLTEVHNSLSSRLVNPILPLSRTISNPSATQTVGTTTTPTFQNNADSNHYPLFDLTNDSGVDIRVAVSFFKNIDPFFDTNAPPSSTHRVTVPLESQFSQHSTLEEGVSSEGSKLPVLSCSTIVSHPGADTLNFVLQNIPLHQLPYNAAITNQSAQLFSKRKFPPSLVVDIKKGDSTALSYPPLISIRSNITFRNKSPLVLTFSFYASTGHSLGRFRKKKRQQPQDADWESMDENDEESENESDSSFQHPSSKNKMNGRRKVQCTYKVTVKPLELFSIPLYLLPFKHINVSIEDESQTRCAESSLFNLIQSGLSVHQQPPSRDGGSMESHDRYYKSSMKILHAKTSESSSPTGFGPYFLETEVSHLPDSSHSSHCSDFTLNVFSGYRFVNALPYKIQLLFTEGKKKGKGSSKPPTPSSGDRIDSHQVVLSAGRTIIIQPSHFTQKHDISFQARFMGGMGGGILDNDQFVMDEKEGKDDMKLFDDDEGEGERKFDEDEKEKGKFYKLSSGLQSLLHPTNSDMKIEIPEDSKSKNDSSSNPKRKSIRNMISPNLTSPWASTKMRIKELRKSKHKLFGIEEDNDEDIDGAHHINPLSLPRVGSLERDDSFIFRASGYHSFEDDEIAISSSFYDNDESVSKDDGEEGGEEENELKEEEEEEEEENIHPRNSITKDLLLNSRKTLHHGKQTTSSYSTHGQVECIDLSRLPTIDGAGVPWSDKVNTNLKDFKGGQSLELTLPIDWDTKPLIKCSFSHSPISNPSGGSGSHDSSGSSNPFRQIPTITFFTDVWIQNETGLFLEYKSSTNILSSSSLLTDSLRFPHDLSNKKKQRPGPVLLPPGTSSISVRGLRRDPKFMMKDSQVLPTLSHINCTTIIHPVSMGENAEWSNGISVTAVNASGELNTGTLWIGFSISGGSGIFGKTKIVTLTPRYILVNQSKIPLLVSPLLCQDAQNSSAQLSQLLSKITSSNPSSSSDKNQKSDLMSTFKKTFDVSSSSISSSSTSSKRGGSSTKKHSSSRSRLRTVDVIDEGKGENGDEDDENNNNDFFEEPKVKRRRSRTLNSEEMNAEIVDHGSLFQATRVSNHPLSRMGSQSLTSFSENDYQTTSFDDHMLSKEDVPDEFLYNEEEKSDVIKKKAKANPWYKRNNFFDVSSSERGKHHGHEGDEQSDDQGGISTPQRGLVRSQFASSLLMRPGEVVLDGNESCAVFTFSQPGEVPFLRDVWGRLTMNPSSTSSHPSMALKLGGKEKRVSSLVHLTIHNVNGLEWMESLSISNMNKSTHDSTSAIKIQTNKKTPDRFYCVVMRDGEEVGRSAGISISDDWEEMFDIPFFVDSLHSIQVEIQIYRGDSSQHVSMQERLSSNPSPTSLSTGISTTENSRGISPLLSLPKGNILVGRLILGYDDLIEIDGGSHTHFSLASESESRSSDPFSTKDKSSSQSLDDVVHRMSFVDDQFKPSLILSSSILSRAKDRWSCPVRVDRVGNEHLNIQDVDGMIVPISVSVFSQGPAKVIQVTEISPKHQPAFCLENRCPDLCILFRQHGTDPNKFPRRILKPAEWTYIGWDDPVIERSLEIMATDRCGEFSMVMNYPIEVVGDLKPLIFPSNGRELKVSVHIKGLTRVLSITTRAIIEHPVERNLLNQKPSQSIIGGTPSKILLTWNWIIRTVSIDIKMTGVTASIIDDTPSELICCSIEGLRCVSGVNSSIWTLSIIHTQVDNMSPMAKSPVILAPVDSGLNTMNRSWGSSSTISSRKDDVGSGGGGYDVNDKDDEGIVHTSSPDFESKDQQLVPWLQVTIDADSEALTAGAIVMRYMEVMIQPVHVNVDVDFVVSIILALTKSASFHLPEITTNAISEQYQISIAKRLLSERIALPTDKTPFIVTFFRILHLHSFALSLHVTVDSKNIGSSLSSNSVVDVFGGNHMIQVLTAVAGTITTMSPSFKFNELVINNAFGPLSSLVWKLAQYYGKSFGLQIYKILGSSELLGDPFGLIENIGTGIVLFFRKTASELVGVSPLRGEGLMALMQNVVGGTFGSAAKVTGSVGELVMGISGIDFDMQLKKRSVPTHLGHGLLQSLELLGSGVVKGVTGLVEKPLEGVQNEGGAGLAKGVVLGVVGLAVTPLVGVFGAATKLAQSVETTTHMLDSNRVMIQSRRRPPRPLEVVPRILPLHLTVVCSALKLQLKGLRLQGGNLLFQKYSSSSSRVVKLYVQISFRHTSLRSPVSETLPNETIQIRWYGEGYGEEDSTNDITINSLASYDERVFVIAFPFSQNTLVYPLEPVKVKLKLKRTFKKDVTIAKRHIHPHDLCVLLGAFNPSMQSYPPPSATTDSHKPRSLSSMPNIFEYEKKTESQSPVISELSMDMGGGGKKEDEEEDKSKMFYSEECEEMEMGSDVSDEKVSDYDEVVEYDIWGRKNEEEGLLEMIVKKGVVGNESSHLHSKSSYEEDSDEGEFGGEEGEGDLDQFHFSSGYENEEGEDSYHLNHNDDYSDDDQFDGYQSSENASVSTSAVMKCELRLSGEFDNAMRGFFSD